MAAVATDIVSRIADLSDGAFAAFCEDIGGMFGVEMQCDRKTAEVSAVRKLREHFKKLNAVHLAKADGALNGTFHLVFDQAGLFILSGVIVMLPESRIIEEAKRGSIEDATNLQDAAREVGNLLAGSWDRVFREDCPGHEHFVKTGTVLGKPWDKPEQIELEANTEVVVVVYEMSIDSYPSFTCGAVFPVGVLSGLGDGDQEPAGQEDPKAAPPADEPARTEKSQAVPPSEPAQKPPAPPAAEKPADPSPVARDSDHGTRDTRHEAASAADSQTAETPENTARADAGDPPVTEPSPQSQEPSPPVVEERPAPKAPDAAARPPEGRPAPAPQTPDQGKRFIPAGRGGPAIDVGKLPSELASTQSGGAAGGSREADFTFLERAYIQSQPQGGLVESLSVSAAEIMEKEVGLGRPGRHRAGRDRQDAAAQRRLRVDRHERGVGRDRFHLEHHGGGQPVFAADVCQVASSAG